MGPIVSKTNMNNLQTRLNSALRIATGCTRDTNSQNIHEESKVLPLNDHIQLHASQLKQNSKLSGHPLHNLNKHKTRSRHKRETIHDNV